MSSINSSSTLAQVQAAYDDNASYAEDNDVSKARAFLTACRILMRRTPRESGTREGHMTLSVDLLKDQITDVQGWLAANDPSLTGPVVTNVNFQNFDR